MQALQISLFLQELHKFVSSLQQSGPVPWILSGDFNTYPYFPLYNIISNGNVTDEGMERLNPLKYKYPQVTKKEKVCVRGFCRFDSLRFSYLCSLVVIFFNLFKVDHSSL